MNNGILKRMKQLLDIYRMVKVVDEGLQWLDEMMMKDKEPPKFKRKGDFIMTPAEGYVKQNFAKKYSKRGYFAINAICNDAVEEGYLVRGINFDPYGKEHDGNDEIDSLGITAKGRRLLDTVPFLPFLPKGLLTAWWEVDKVIIKLLLTFITAVVAYAGTGAVLTLVRGIIKP